MDAGAPGRGPQSRIIKFMDVRYEGANQGYINRAENFAEYRFDPVEGERHFRLVQLYARQKHVVVRCTLFVRRRGSGPGKIKTLKNASGNDYYVLEFAATADNSLDELEALGVNSVEINRYGLPVRASKWFSRRLQS